MSMLAASSYNSPAYVNSIIMTYPSCTITLAVTYFPLQAYIASASNQATLPSSTKSSSAPPTTGHPLLSSYLNVHTLRIPKTSYLEV